jgi:glycosyltransferase involved in cell wall biosynthesis
MLTTSFPRYEGDFAGNFIYELSQQLVADGVSVQVVAPADIGAVRDESMHGVAVSRFKYICSDGQQRIAYRDGGLPVTLQQGWRAKAQLLPFSLSFWSAALSQCRKCDLIHAHWTLAGLMAVTQASVLRKPTVLTAHGSDINLARGKLLDRFNWHVLQAVDRITVVSDDLKDKIIELGICADRVTVLPNAVNEARFCPMARTKARHRLGLSPDCALILFVGSLIELKGVLDLVEAMSQVSAQISTVQLALVGGGYLRERLEDRVRELGLEKRVLFFGLQPSGEIPVWMNAADILVLPSYSEGRPTVVLEAMACETAVVGTDIGGNRELIRSGETGLLAEVGNPLDLAEKLLVLLRDPALCQYMGRQGRQVVLGEGFTWRDSARKLKTIYAEMLAS